MTAKKRTARYATTTRRRPTTQQAEAEPSPEPDVDPPRTTSRALGDALTWNHAARPREISPEPGPDAFEYNAADDVSAMTGMDNPPQPKPTRMVGPDAVQALRDVDLTRLFQRDAIAETTAAYVRAPANGQMVPSKTVLEVTLTSGQSWYVCAWPGGCTRGSGRTPYVSDHVESVTAHQSTHSAKHELRLAAEARAQARAEAKAKPRRKYSTGVRLAVLEFITEHVDNPVTVRTIAGHTGHTERSIASVLTKLRRDNEEGRPHLDTYRRGGQTFWVWRSDAALNPTVAPEPEPEPAPVSTSLHEDAIVERANRRDRGAYDAYVAELERRVSAYSAAASAQDINQWNDRSALADTEGTTELPDNNPEFSAVLDREAERRHQRYQVSRYEEAMRQISKPDDVANAFDASHRQLELEHTFTYVGKTSAGTRGPDMLVRDESTGVIYRVVSL